MSVRAYRVNKVELEEASTFNIWHDDKLVNYLDIMCDMNENGGYVEVAVGALKDAIEELDLDEDTVRAVKVDIAWAKKKETDWVQYMCW